MENILDTRGGGSQAGGINAGAAVAYGAMSQYTSNGVLQATSLGF